MADIKKGDIVKFDTGIHGVGFIGVYLGKNDFDRWKGDVDVDGVIITVPLSQLRPWQRRGWTTNE